MTRRDHRFRKAQRVKLDRDFARAFDYRCSSGDKIMVIYVCPNGVTWPRLGIRIAARYGTAVDRTRLRRRIREAFRTCQDRIPAGYDFICIPRRAAGGASIDVAASLIRLASKAVTRAENRSHNRAAAPPERT